MAGLMLPVRFGLRKGRKVLEASVSAGRSQKYQLRRSTSSRTIDGPKIEYPKSVNETKPVTSARRKCGKECEQAKHGRAAMKEWGDNSINRARSRIARGEALLPHQSSAWSKHKNSTRGRGY